MRQLPNEDELNKGRGDREHAAARSGGIRATNNIVVWDGNDSADDGVERPECQETNGDHTTRQVNRDGEDKEPKRVGGRQRGDEKIEIQIPVKPEEDANRQARTSDRDDPSPHKVAPGARRTRELVGQ